MRNLRRDEVGEWWVLQARRTRYNAACGVAMPLLRRKRPNPHGDNLMKRTIYTILVLIAGAGLGGGGVYIGTHWDKFNPFATQDTKETLHRLIADLRKACATEPALKGAVIKSADVADGKLALRGLV